MEVNLDCLRTLDRFDKTSKAVQGQIEKCRQHMEYFIASTFISSEGRVQEIRKDLQTISTRYNDIITRASFLVQRAKSRNEHYLQVACKVLQDQISPGEAAKELVMELNDLVTMLRNVIGEHNEVIQLLRKAVDVKSIEDERKHANLMQSLQTVLTTAIMALVVGVVTVANIEYVKEWVAGALLALVGWATGGERIITPAGVAFSEVAVAAIMSSVARITSRSLCCTGALAAGGALVMAATRQVVKVMPLPGIVVSAGLVGIVSVAIKESGKPKAAWKDNEEHYAWKLKGARFTKELDEIEEYIREANRDLGEVDLF